MSRLAVAWRVFFIEEPDGYRHEANHWEFEEAAANLTVCRPRSTVEAHGYNDEQLPVLRDMVRTLLDERGIAEYAVWTYTPLAMPLIAELNPQFVVYDCMDELSQFLNAPAELIRQEKRLLKRADLVFTGGPSLYRSKKSRHPNVHCFSSSVDETHFEKARGPGAEPAVQEPVPHPRLGYFGVIDERIDLPLLAALADAEPNWQITMVGPVVKIDPSTLPQRPNIHYFGQQPYTALPDFLRGWDACLLPFARNPATEFISPTKTLEYMAADKPIVGTPITDVAEPYGHIVYLGNDAPSFIAACRAALHADDAERKARRAAARKVLDLTSWDKTVAAMQAELEKVWKRKRPEQGAQGDGREAAADRERTIVIGAGPTGLSAAFHFPDALLLEQNDSVGGWCRSIVQDGFTFDFAGHIMFSNDPYVHEMYTRLLGDNVHWQEREAWIYSHDVYTRYPFQGALYGLPPEVIKECILGAIEARYGTASAPAPSSNGHGTKACDAHANGNGSSNGHGNGNGHPKAAPGKVEDCCGDGVLESTVALKSPKSPLYTTSADGSADQPAESESFESFIYRVWGRGIAKHFAIPYNRKLWSVPLSEMETSWLGGRVPMPDLGEMIEGAIRPVAKPMGPNARFGYPLRGGFQALMNGFLPHVQDRLELNARVARISLRDRTVHLHDGRTYRFEQLISTMPLPVLVRSLGDEASDEIRAAADKLRHVSVRCVHLGIDREQITEKHWIYYPEQTVFHRIFVQGNASPHCNPQGGFGLTCEITYSPYKPLPCDGQELIDRCIADCRAVGIISDDDAVVTALQADLPYAYVVYDHARRESVDRIRVWLAERGILLAGRYSEWEYYNSDHAFIAGKKAAETLMERRNPRLSAKTEPMAT
jgi:UDP-galactopyranose mutase